jgi:hypothetical protein
MDRVSDFSATREIAEISVHYHNIRGGVGGGTASMLVKNSLLGDHRYCSVY